jgi:hypothetical protein
MPPTEQPQAVHFPPDLADVPVAIAADAGAAPSSGILPATELEVPLTGQETGLVEDRSDQLMAGQSVDGQPPSHGRRMRDWKFLAVIAGTLLFLAVAFAIARAMAITEIAIGAVLLVFAVLLGGWPVIGAGLLRGKEERSARKEAVIEVRQDTVPRQHR